MQFVDVPFILNIIYCDRWIVCFTYIVEQYLPTLFYICRAKDISIEYARYPVLESTVLSSFAHFTMWQFSSCYVVRNHYPVSYDEHHCKYYVQVKCIMVCHESPAKIDPESGDK